MQIGLGVSKTWAVKRWPQTFWATVYWYLLRWKTMYDFLLVRRCNYSSIWYHFRVIWRWIISWPWNLA